MFRTAAEEVPNHLQNFAFLALGILAIVLALFMAWVLYRVTRTLTAVEELVVTTTEEMRETLPEVRESIGHVNDITAGVNVGLRTVGSGASDMSGRLRENLKGPANAAAAAAHGVKVGAATLWRSLLEGE
jgi:uncharacterized protein YoxC